MFISCRTAQIAGGEAILNICLLWLLPLQVNLDMSKFVAPAFNF